MSATATATATPAPKIWTWAFLRTLGAPGAGVAAARPAIAVANMAVRGCTLASRAVLIVFFARFLTPAELGLYGLFSVSIGLVLYLLGFDFYNYATRELLAHPREDWPAMLRDQAVFHLATYVVILPMLVALFISRLLPWTQAGWFYLILILEHISQEFYRLLLTNSQSFLANVAHFVRAGAWVFVFVGIALVYAPARSLTSVWLCWAAGDAAGIVVALLALAHLPWRRALTAPIDLRWIRRGIRISGRLLAGTVAMWGISTFDRYILQHYEGINAVGIYSFYMSVASAIVVFVDAGVVAPLYPALVSAAVSDPLEYARVRRRFSRSVWFSSVTLAAAAAIAIRPVLRFINRPAYSSHLDILWFLLLFAVISLVSRPATYALYAQKRDNQLVLTAVAGLIALAALGPLLTAAKGVAGIALAVCISMAVMGIGRFGCERLLVSK